MNEASPHESIHEPKNARMDRLAAVTTPLRA